MSDRDFAEAIAMAFQPGMGDAVRWAEAEERVRIQARAAGLDGDAIVDRAKFRYLESPRSGTDFYIELLDDVLREETI